MQESGTLRVGDKLPSLRKLSQQLDVSIPTVKLAYMELERQDLITAQNLGDKRASQFLLDLF